MPARERVREEVEQNPHQVPPSYLEFADRMAEKMKVAKISEREALTLYSELESCALQSADSAPLPARTLCFSNAFELSRLYPKLEGRHRALEGRIPADLARMMKMQEKLE